jgi:hypothetical protein
MDMIAIRPTYTPTATTTRPSQRIEGRESGRCEVRPLRRCKKPPKPSHHLASSSKPSEQTSQLWFGVENSPCRPVGRLRLQLIPLDNPSQIAKLY